MTVSVPKKTEAIVAFAFLTLLILAALWKLTFMQGLVITDDIFASDIMNEGFPYRYAISEALKSGHLSLWVPNIYGGFPLLARAEAGVCYPFNLILFGLLNPYVALNVVILLTLIIAAFSMYLYMREIDGSFAAGLAAGVAFAFSGYMVSHVKHLSNVNAACWLPLGLFFLERALKRNEFKQYIWFGIIFGIQHLSGHTQIAYYSGLMYIAYFVFRSINVANEISTQIGRTSKAQGSNKPLPHQWIKLVKSRATLSFVSTLLLGSLLGAVQLIPTYELVSQSQRSGGVTFQYASKYAYDPSNVAMFLFPYINGDIGNNTYTGQSIFWEDYGYVGIVVFLLAVYASFRMWKLWYVKFFTTAALASIFLVLGSHTPVFEAAFTYIPGMKYFRFPTRFLLITDFSLIVLGSIGFTSLASRFARTQTEGRRDRTGTGIRSIEMVGLALIIIDLLFFQLRQNPIVDAKTWITPPKSVQFLRQDTSMYRIFCIGGNQAHTRTFEAAGGWEGDLQPYIEQREFIQPSGHVLYGFSTPDGYANLTPNYLVDIWGDQNRAGLIKQTAGIQGELFAPTPLFLRLMDMSNVKYLTSLWKIVPHPTLKYIGQFGDAYLYENLNVMPRAYLVGKIIRVDSILDAERMLFSNTFDPRRSVILYDQPAVFDPADSVSGSVELIQYTPNEVTFNVQSEREAILVFSDTYYPGWVAEVDWREVPLYQANVTQRTVVIPAGHHTVSFAFRPTTVAVGFWVTIGSIAVFGVMFVMVGRRKQSDVTTPVRDRELVQTP